MRHIIKLECWYATEALNMTEKGGFKDIKNREKKMVRMILRKNESRRDESQPNQEVYQQTEGVVELMKKRRVQFYRHLLRMDRNRLMKGIF